MKPFKSSEFISNEETPVITRNSTSIHIITVRGRGKQPVIGYVDSGSTPNTWSDTGAYSQSCAEDVWDLFFTQKVEVVYMFEHKESGIVVPMCEKDDAEAWIKDADYTYLGTITGPIVPPEKSEVKP